MAPTTEKIGQLFARYYCNSGYGYSNSNNCYRSSWSWWGRWVFAGVVIFVVLLALVLLGCRNSRRRRKRGLSPRYGTGWMASGPKYAPQNNPGGYAPPPPQYTPAGQNQPNTGYNNNNYQGYYGGQQEGVQPPQGTYYPPGNGDNYYQAPPGPPPNK